mgnify:CR=1 FL=1
MQFKRLNNSHVTVLAMAAKDRDEKVKKKKTRDFDGKPREKDSVATSDWWRKRRGQNEEKTRILTRSIHSSGDRYETPCAAAE